jgi:hypothetical protein
VRHRYRVKGGEGIGEKLDRGVYTPYTVSRGFPVEIKHGGLYFCLSFSLILLLSLILLVLSD